MKRRSTRLAVDQVRALDHFAEALFVMFPTQIGVVHVGSSLDSDDWRDVDVRVVLADDEYDDLCGLLAVEDLGMLLSRWGQVTTGLPIDCQLQPMREHASLGFGEGGKPLHRWRGAGRLGTEARHRRDSRSESSPSDGGAS